MRNVLKIFFVMMLLSSKTFAQTQAFAISSISGILESKIEFIKAGDNAYNVRTVTDTITLQEAQSIFALNVIARSSPYVKKSIRCFDLLINYGYETITLQGTSDILTNEMKDALKKVRSGAIIHFVKIEIITQGFLHGQSVSTIKYYVK